MEIKNIEDRFLVIHKMFGRGTPDAVEIKHPGIIWGRVDIDFAPVMESRRITRKFFHWNHFFTQLTYRAILSFLNENN